MLCALSIQLSSIWENYILKEGKTRKATQTICTYIDHGIGCDPKESGPFVDLLDLLVALGGQPQGLQLAEGALQRRAVLGYQVVARAQVLHLAGQGPQGVLQLCLVGL